MSGAAVQCALASMLVAIIVGCAAREDLPTFPRTDAETSRLLLAERLGGVRTIAAEGNVTLRRADGQSIRLDAAVAAEPPGRVRLRAWKFGQAALDLTLTPDGLWVVQPRRSTAEQAEIPAGLNAEEFRRMWRLLGGGIFDEPGVAVDVSGDELVATVRREGEPTVVARTDRDTLTPRRYSVLDDGGGERFVLRLDRYRDFGGGIVWPMRMTADSADQGRISIDLRSAEFNVDLPQAAFQPPRRARKVDP